ncbi:MAG: peroxide stress protein YaaA [Lachnospiraceae bacterium]|nr:peroxide stress protein YaaA [Lachnospiraceae bacterium]MDY5742134.1 peroxide stress protein YaaA [Lachnospiraceae bacterium]
MKIILAPAKRQLTAEKFAAIREQYGLQLPEQTEPLLKKKTQILIDMLSAMQPPDLAAAMRIKDELAMQTYIQYQEMRKGKAVGTPALWSYIGLAYRYLQAETLTETAIRFACEHLRIPDALYGLLRPTDRILPYRLDMLAAVKPEGKNIYRFWGSDWADHLMEGETELVNLASTEFSKAVLPYLPPKIRVIQVDFKTMKNGKWIIPTTLAKMARGAMARYICLQQLQTVHELTGFQEFGFAYRKDLSTTDHLVYVQN